MSDRPAPWWYSGDDDPEPATGPAATGTGPERDDAAGGSAFPGLGDLTGLLSGAARMVDWATSAVMAPHAEHTDPADHPQCIVCRTVTLVGDPIGLMGTGTADTDPSGADRATDSTTGATAGTAPDSTPAHADRPTITWIPVRDDPSTRPH